MISYEIYKIIHILMAFLFFTMSATIFFAAQKSKVASILSGIATLFILVSGMGLMARLGISHGAAWPKWIVTKFALFFFLAIGAPVVAKRLPIMRLPFFVAMFVSLGVILFAAITKF